MPCQSLSSKWPAAKARRGSVSGVTCDRVATQAPGHFQLNARRLLKYWSGPRCCGFWRWPRRERSADIRSDLGQASNAGQRQNPRNRVDARQKGSWRGRLLVTARLTGCASLVPYHLPFCLYARPTPVFEQFPKGPSSLGDWQVIPVTQHWPRLDPSLSRPVPIPVSSTPMRSRPVTAHR